MKIICCASAKGGVGKSTLAAYLGLAYLGMGKRVLMVDLDPNNNLTDFLFHTDAEADKIMERNAFHALTERIPVDKAIHPSISFGVDAIPCTQALHRAGVELAGDPGVLIRWSQALRALPYEIIIIDTPPALVIELRAGLYAADLVLSPVYPHRWIAQGHEIMAEETARAGKTLGKMPRLLIVPYMVNTETEKARMEVFSGKKTAHAILRRASIRKNAELGKALSKTDAAAFRSLAEEIEGIK